jgi:hypothetical protein
LPPIGNFLTTEQWFDDGNDPFGRAPSVITYDYEKKAQVKQDRRVWVAGLSDEAGAGSWLGAIMKQLIMPDPEEVKKMEDFVNQTLWGGIQYNEGHLKYGVRKSLFYYEPESMPEGTYDKDIRWAPNGNFPSWNTKETNSAGRSYNYPHVAAAHWVMYRLARNYQDLVTQQEWQWYLENAFHTSMAMIKLAPHYAQFGQMEGTVFILILNDLKAEGMTKMAADLETAMKARVDVWMKLKYPSAVRCRGTPPARRRFTCGQNTSASMRRHWSHSMPSLPICPPCLIGRITATQGDSGISSSPVNSPVSSG